MTITAIAPVITSGRLRAACYVRVSTDLPGQDESYEAQRRHFEHLLEQHPEFELVGIYMERISGTHMETRPELARMLEECRCQRVDIVITKSISRLARNTADLIQIVRSIRSFGTHVIFERENIDTRTADSEFLMTLLAGFAEQESRSISDNTRWAIRKRFESGTFRNAQASFGYELVNDSLRINPEEAAVVRGIFRDYLSGNGCRSIAKRLNAEGISPGLSEVSRNEEFRNEDFRHESWDAGAVSAILKNETYIGNKLLQKSYSDETYKVRRNRGELPMYRIEGHHEAIVDRETFERAAALLVQRNEEFPQGKRNVYILTGKCVCGLCGSLMSRETVKLAGGVKVMWGCRRHRRDVKSCPMRAVPEDNIKNAFITMLNKLRFCDLILTLFAEQKEAEWRRRHGAELLAMEEKVRRNSRELMQIRYVRSGEAAFLKRRNGLLREKEELAAKMKSFGKPERGPVEEIRGFLKKWDGKEFPEKEFGEFVERVRVEDQRTFCFCFKCGLRLTE